MTKALAARLMVCMAVGACGLFLGGCATADRSNPAPAVIERSFAQGGSVVMRLSSGEYLVEGTPGDQIRLRWKTRDAAQAHRVRADVRVEGTAATIRTEGPSNGFFVTIAVPRRADLWVRLTAGRLVIGGIEGHKDVSAWAGEMTIGVDPAASYRAVDASVLAGEIKASAFNRSTGGVFRSFQWSGDGRYELSARLTAGEISLREN